MSEIEKEVEILKFYESQDYFFSKDIPALYAFRNAISALEKQIPKLAEFIEPFGKFKCPSCGEMYDACYDEETGEPSVWFNHCPECGQAVKSRDI